MMPLAFDLISTLVIGSILPVATTDRTIVPRSTVAIFDGIDVGGAPFSAAKPQTPGRRATQTRHGPSIPTFQRVGVRRATLTSRLRYPSTRTHSENM